MRRLAHALAVSSLLTLGLAPLQAAEPVLPTGLSVVAGQAQVSTTGSRMTVTNSSQAILNWNSFSIGKGAGVYFQQPNAASQVLNRVTGGDASSILGSLGSNGRVWLLNPNGVLFGASARVDVGGLVASTLRLSDADWLAGRYALSAGTHDAPSAAVVNQGEIRTVGGGTLALIAGTVGNEGLMQAPGGQVVLAAGSSVELVDTGTANVSVRISAPAGEARNLGVLAAAGGRVDITAASVNQSGIVRADALGSGPGGEVWILASQDIDMAAGSLTSADGDRGGRVVLQADAGRTTVSGAVSARGTQGVGGEAVLLGKEVGLLDGARVDVVGATGGGQVFVGGGERGQDARFANARAVFIGEKAVLSADATDAGDGGRIVVWADSATRAYGSFSARGGPLGGQGGFIETSGGWIDARPSFIDTHAPMGQGGEWLIDPYNILISDTASDTLGSGPLFTANGPSSSISSRSISLALGRGSDVVVWTGGSGSGEEHGDIDVVDARISPIRDRAGPTGSLTLRADGDIRMLRSSITTPFQPMTVTLLAGESGSGGISLTNSQIVSGSSGNFGDVGLRANAADGLVELVDSQVSGAEVQIETRSASLSGSTVVTGNAPGDAIVLSGLGAPLERFVNTAGAGALRVTNPGTDTSPAGRWIVYATDINDADNFAPGALAPAFRRHNAGFGDWSGDAGNGLVFSAEQVATVTGNVLSREYDGTTNATFSSVAIATSVADEVASVAGASIRFASKDAGLGIAVDFDPAGPITVQTRGAPPIPVYGYTVVSELSGDILPRAVTAPIVAFDKVYDGSTAARVSLGPLTPLVGEERLGVVASGRFDSKNVGVDRPVTVEVALLDGSNGGLASNYRFVATPASVVADITPLNLAVSGLGASDKVYDGTTVARLTGTASVSGLSGDDLTLGGKAVGAFADKNVGVGKAVSVGGLTLSGADAGNYSLVVPGDLTASITALGLTVTGVSASDKVYDGTTVATLTGTASVSGLSGDDLTLGGKAVGAFADKNVGVDKAVSVGGLTLTGADAGNYSLVAPGDLTATITSATLLYVAEPATRTAGTPLTDLRGSVAGFMPGDTLGSATTGALEFTAQAPTLSEPGRYPVTGAGLTAMNYRFEQAPTNVDALTIVGGAVDGFGPSLLTVPRIEPPPVRDEGGLVSLLTRPEFDGTATPIGNFGPRLVTALSGDDVTALLSGRERYKDQLLAEARDRLLAEPTLPNLGQCMSLEEAQQGRCLITEQLKIRAAQEQSVLAAAQPSPAALPDIATTSLDDLPPTAAGPAQGSVPPVVSRPSASASATPAQAVAEPSSAPDVLALARPSARAPVVPYTDPLQAQLDLMLANYRVKSAALPQIERKIALVVGVDRYADPTVPALDNAIRDAKAVAKLFESQLGYESMVLENATRASLVAALNRLALSMGPEDSVVVYYAGHGELVESTGLGYWLLSDSKAKDPSTWLSNTDITRLIGQIGVRQLALVSDSCYSGSLAAEERIRASPKPPDPQNVLSRKTVVVMTSGGNEPVFDQGRDGHSPFAWNLLKALAKVDAWQPGGNVFERVRFAVARALPQRPQYSSSKASGHQPGGDYLYEERQLDAPK